MGSEIFKLNSLYMDDTVVRGSRLSIKNAKETKTVIVNPGDNPQIKTGETGVNAEYLIQASLSANDLKGVGTFTNNSDIVTAYSGPQDVRHGDIVRLDSDIAFYTVTGMQGTNIYLTSKFIKPTGTEDVQSGPTTVRKVKLDSVQYETVKNPDLSNHIYYDRNNSAWGITGINPTGPITAPSKVTPYMGETGMHLQFLSGTQASKPDLLTVGTVYKTIVDNNTSPVREVSLSPLPYPHTSLKVFIGKSGGTVVQKTEYEDYAVNYSQNPDFVHPIPPYEDRQGAYIKFLDKLTDEVQVPAIDATFEGNISITRSTSHNNVNLTQPISNIVPTDTFVMDVGGIQKKGNFEYIPDFGAGIVRFVKHKNSEPLIESIAYTQDLMWDGMSVIKGVGISGVQDMKNLVIQPIKGLAGITGMVYYEDNAQNDLVRNVDYVLNDEAGVISLTAPLKDTESVLVSYYVEGNDVSSEKISLDNMRVSEYPVLNGTVVITEQYTSTIDNKQVTSTRVLIEGQDYTFSYITGRITLISISGDEEIVSLQASYTPMAQINVILQPVSGQTLLYRMTIVDDVLKVINPEKLVFQINNPVVSIPTKATFPDPVTNSNYTFSGTVLPKSLLWVRDMTGTVNYGVTGYTYDDVKDVPRQLTLDPSHSKQIPNIADTIVATYSFESELLPYAPIQVINTIFNAGDNYILIEGFDRTDVLKAGMTLRIDNYDPEHTLYYKIQSVTYTYGNTLITFYGTFPETIINPTFYLFDDNIVWTALPAVTIADTSTPVLSESIVLTGDPLHVKQGIKKDSLILVNDEQIYTVTSVVTSGKQSTIGIFPSLLQPITGSIKYSALPVHNTGDTNLRAQYHIMQDPTQPAFTLSYQAPSGFEGSAKILVDKSKIVLTESIRGITNPQSYTYQLSDYSDIYSLAKAIQATPSTYRVNVPLANVPDYNPFTIYPTGNIEDDYYLSPGAWSTSTIIPFEDATPLGLPYTFRIVPELFKWSLLQASVNQGYFRVVHADRTKYFAAGQLLAFRDRIYGDLYFYQVTGTALVPNLKDATIKDTQVSLSDTFRKNLLNPTVYKYDAISWMSASSAIASIDYKNSTITFASTPQNNMRTSTMLRIKGSYIYQIKSMTVDSGSYTVTLSPVIDTHVKMETYSGYVEQSTVPVYLDDPGPQPYISIQYTAPVGHTGTATVKIDATKITLTETLDNFNVKPVHLAFADYTDIGALVTAIQAIPTAIGGFTPYTVTIPEVFAPSFVGDGFKNYRLSPTIGRGMTLPATIQVTVSSLSIAYTAPTGHVGSATIKVLPTEVVLTETIVAYKDGQDVSHEERRAYSSAQSLVDFATRVIPGVPSLVSPTVHSYSCTPLNTDLFGAGLWGSTHVVSYSAEAVEAPTKVFGTEDGAHWYTVGVLNERSLVAGTDYEISTGTIDLTDAVVPLDRYRLNYMGLWNLAEYEGSAITCTCRYFSELPTGSRVDVYLDYLNIDQFYFQKLTERKFSQLVVIPQISDILDQMGSGGQSSDSGANNNTTPNWQGGVADLYYLLRDEQIKMQLYLRFYQWYKERLRDLSAELQLMVGFKFAHSNALGLDPDGNYTLDDEYVETNDYTLTSDDDIGQIVNGFSKFFPVGYSDAAPKYYDRFGAQYLSYNDVYCCNITWTNPVTGVETVGIVKSEIPYWGVGLDFKVWSDDSVGDGGIGVGKYQVDVPSADRTFDANTYTFLKRVSVGDSIQLSTAQDSIQIAQIVSPVGKNYEYLILASPFTTGKKTKKRRKGIKTYDIHLVQETRPGRDHTRLVSVLKKGNPYSRTFETAKYHSFDDNITPDDLLDSLPPDGFNIYVQRQQIESFPMSDDYGSLGASAYGEHIDGHITNSRRIKKPMLKALLALLFPFAPTDLIPEPTKKFKVQVKKDSESGWVDLDNGEIDLSKLTFKEVRNVDDTMDALRFDFTLKAVIPPIPPPAVPSTIRPKYIYEITEEDSKGFHINFCLSFENIYDANTKGGYYQGIVFRAKNKEWWFKIVNGDGDNNQAIVGDYGFDPANEYRNFFDPDCMYKRILIEKQAWQTEELILKDLYDHSDKIARAFDQGNLNVTNSTYQGYLARLSVGTAPGVSDVLMTRIPVYEKQLAFLINTQGPVYQTLYPDYVHPENVASSAIATTFQKTSIAWNTYKGAWDTEQFFKGLNNENNNTWRTEYVRWVLGLEPGLVYQKDAKQMYEQNTGTITVGLKELLALKIGLVTGGSHYCKSATVTVYSDYSGKHIRIDCSIVEAANLLAAPTDLPIRFDLKKTADSYKDLDEVTNDINVYRYPNAAGSQLFSCSNVFPYYENFVVSNMTGVSGVAIDPVQGVALTVTSVPDHRDSDPRVLFLNRGIEDRVYTHGIRDVPGFALTYLGDYYTYSTERSALLITTLPGTYVGGLSFRVSLDGSGNRTLTLNFRISNTSTDIPIEFPLYDYVAGAYITLQALIDNINKFAFQGGYPIFGAELKYDVAPYGALSAEYLSTNDTFINGVSVGGGWEFICTLYSHVSNDLDVIDTDINQSQYRVYYDTDFTKKMEMSFTQIYKDGSVIVTDPTKISDSLIFNLQNPDRSFKTIAKLCTEISTRKYKDVLLFSATPISQSTPKSQENIVGTVLSGKESAEAGLPIQHSPGSTLSTEYLVVTDTYVPLGIQVATDVYVDTVTVDITDPTSPLSVLSNQNAFFSHLMYTSNGNVNKQPIDGIPVSGSWSTTANEPVMTIECNNGTTWDVTYNNFDSGNYKDYNPAQIVAQIDAGGSITAAQYTSLSSGGFDVGKQPQVTIIKELVLKRAPYADVTNISEAFTANVTTDKLTVTLSDWSVGDVVRFTTTGQLPVPLTVGTDYYIVSKVGTSGTVELKVSLTSNGNAIDLISVGTGPYTITRQTVGILKVNLRQYSTIASLVDPKGPINGAKFSEAGVLDPTGPVQYFTASGIGLATVQGQYKSYELDAEYTPIVRSFVVVEANGSETPHVNKLIGWEITTKTSPVGTPVTLSMSAKRYSPGQTYPFTMNPPDVSYVDTLTNNPKGFREDTLAFDVYSWDDSGYYEVKDNWMYFRSAHVGYSAAADLGQPDKTLGCGIPLAGSRNDTASPTENVGTLVTRINQHNLINKWFYANLNFTRYSNKSTHTVNSNPGFFEYGYLPNFHSNVPKSTLDSVMLRNDSVMTIGPGTIYNFSTSSYTVDNTAKTIDLSCDWSYDYPYSKEYDFNSLTTVAGLSAAINVDTAAQLGASVFEANVVGAHGTDITTSLLADSGDVAEVTEPIVSAHMSCGVTAVPLTSDFLVSLGTWHVNDVVRFTTTGTLPSVQQPFPLPPVPMSVGVDYYVVGVSGTAPVISLQISDSVGGVAFTVAGAGTGAHTVARQSYDLQVYMTDWMVNDLVRFTNSGGSLPIPLLPATDYYVTSVTVVDGYRILRVSATLGGLPVIITDGGTGLHIIHRVYVDLSVEVLSQLQSSLQLKIRNLSGVNFTIENPRYQIPVTRDKLVLTCTIHYHDTYSLVGYDISSLTVGGLVAFISSITVYPDAIFAPLFQAHLVHKSYKFREAARLLDVIDKPIVSGTLLYAKLNDIVAMNILNMEYPATIDVSTNDIVVTSFGIYSDGGMPVGKDIYGWIDGTLYGSYTQGMISIDTLPLKVDRVSYGLPDVTHQKALTVGNTPAHVYFGVLGDIQWIQISDKNLHTQLNYVKERLGRPWKDSQGLPVLDYYTPERYDGSDNPYAIDMAHFLGYLKTVRYNEIKDSIVNEALVSNKYFWLYMKFHREIGCDQRVIALKKQISSKKNQQDILGEL